MSKNIFVLIQLIWLVIVMIMYMHIRKIDRQNKKEKLNSKKLYINSAILSDWLEIKTNDCEFDDWLIHFGINRVAIYGFGVLGRTLYNELKKSKIEVECIVDKNSNNIQCDVKCVSPDTIPDVDAIIITVVTSYDEIEADLIKKYNAKILSIEDVLYGIGAIR